MSQKIIADPSHIPQSSGLLKDFGFAGLEALKEVGKDGVDFAICLGWQSNYGRQFINYASEDERHEIRKSLDLSPFMEIRVGKPVNSYAAKYIPNNRHVDHVPTAIVALSMTVFRHNTLNLG